MARTLDPIMVTECPICASPDLFETTTLDSAYPSFICVNGHSIKPDREAEPMALTPYGPDVPTPEDLLRAACLDPPIWWP